MGATVLSPDFYKKPGKHKHHEEPEFVPGRRYKTKEIAQHFGVKPETVASWIKARRIRATKMPKGYSILGKDANDFAKTK